MNIHESGENYLETILLLKKRNGSVRSIDIANELEYTKPSISRAMGILKKSGYIVIDKSGNISLTELGEKVSNEIYERHKLITQFLVSTLGVDENIASKDACRIEHVISSECFEKVKEYIAKNS